MSGKIYCTAKLLILGHTEVGSKFSTPKCASGTKFSRMNMTVMTVTY